MKINKFLLGLICLLVITSANAQETQPVEMADLFYKEGKIYLVLAIVSLVFGGMVIYLFLMDRKLNKLEKKINSKQNS